MKFRLVCLFLIVLLVLGACSGSKTFKPITSGNSPKVLVLLETESPPDMSRERIAYIQNALLSELKSSGFYVLEPGLTSAKCGGSDCPNRKVLAQSFGAQGFLKLKLDSISRNNFIAGYYNSVGGSVVLSDVNSKELFSFKHSESEKGGLLFNTGQIFQGLKSQVANSKADSFDALADNFVKGLVARMPAAEKEAAPESDLRIVKTSAKALGNGVYYVCGEGSLGALGYLVIGRERSNLREVNPGNYCGNFALSPLALQGRNPQIELRSALGSSVRSDLAGFKSQPVCDLEGIVQLSNSDPNTKLYFECQNDASSCEERLKQCMGHHYVVYRAPQSLGPYTKVAQFEQREWIDRSSGKQNAYVLVVTNADGFRSRPFAAEKVRRRS